jgi:hypothetical protein
MVPHLETPEVANGVRLNGNSTLNGDGISDGHNNDVLNGYSNGLLKTHMNSSQLNVESNGLVRPCKRGTHC